MSTRGNLKPAELINENTNHPTPCMFNPYEYTISKQNQYSMGDSKGLNCPVVDYKQGGAKILRLKLFFDTYTEGDNSADIRTHTDELWAMMMVDKRRLNPRTKKSEPPRCIFAWGVFRFRAVITSISQTMTLFTKDGTPVRATVDITLQQYVDRGEPEEQNPTSGGGVTPKTRPIDTGDRLDLLAWDEYHDCAKWPLIAAANQIVDPLALRPGQVLVIPPLEDGSGSR